MYAFSLFITLLRPRVGTILIHSADSPGFPCLATEIIWCCQGIFMKATEVNNLLFASRPFFFFVAAHLSKLSVLPLHRIRLPTKGPESSDPTSTQRGTLVISPPAPTLDGKKKEYIISFARGK